MLRFNWSFLKDWRRYAPGSLRVHKRKRNVRPEDGDLVLVKSEKLGDMGCYGVVAKFLSPQTVLIKLKGGGEIECAVGQTFPLVPNCILKQWVCFRNSWNLWQISSSDFYYHDYVDFDHNTSESMCCSYMSRFWWKHFIWAFIHCSHGICSLKYLKMVIEKRRKWLWSCWLWIAVLGSVVHIKSSESERRQLVADKCFCCSVLSSKSLRFSWWRSNQEWSWQWWYQN